MEHLDPTINRSAWTKEEEDILMEKFKEFGTKRREYQRFLPYRTTEQIGRMIKKMKNNK